MVERIAESSLSVGSFERKACGCLAGLPNMTGWTHKKKRSSGPVLHEKGKIMNLLICLPALCFPKCVPAYLLTYMYMYLLTYLPILFQ